LAIPAGAMRINRSASSVLIVFGGEQMANRSEQHAAAA
jgi:hypothetical protein